MAELSQQQLEQVKARVNGHSARYQFLSAHVTDKDRRLVVVTAYTTDGKPHAVSVDTKKEPNWLTNEAQFSEVVDAALGELSKPF